jgi:uncharacterized protein YkwD
LSLIIPTKKPVVLALALVTTSATLAVRAEQSPSTAPATGAAPAAVKAPKVVPVAARPASAAASPAPVQPVQPRPPAGDPYGFTQWLNGVRASYGLPAVGYDPNLEAWGQQNNMQQNARGIGHFVMGPARRQNSAMGHYAQIGAMWMASPGHQAALLDPTIRWIGIAGMGAYWTFNAY